MRVILLLASLLLLAPLTGGSIIEQRTGIRYQYDGGQHGDASDTCALPHPLVPRGASATGLLVPPDDVLDFYGLPVSGGGQKVRVVVDGEDLSRLTHRFSIVVYSPGCGRLIGDSMNSPSFEFNTEEPGTYSVGLRQTARGVPLPGGGSFPPGDDPPRDCHPICVGTANGAIGYTMTVS